MNFIFNSNLIKALTLVFITNASVLCLAQKDLIAKQKNKFGFILSLDQVSFTNTPNASIYYNRDNRVVASAGFKFNFRQIKSLPNANISIGIKIRHLTFQTEYRINADDLDLNADLNLITQDSPYWTYHLPINFDYVLCKSKNSELYTTAGLEFQFYGITEGTETFNQLNVRDTPIIVNTVSEHQNSLTYGLNAGIGFNLYTNRGSMYQIGAQYHYHFQTMERSTITVTNLAFSDTASSSHNWRNNSFGITFSYFPSFKFNRRNE